jgi:hypothetical protein
VSFLIANATLFLGLAAFGVGLFCRGVWDSLAAGFTTGLVVGAFVGGFGALIATMGQMPVAAAMNDWKFWIYFFATFWVVSIPATLLGYLVKWGARSLFRSGRSGPL